MVIFGFVRGIVAGSGFGGRGVGGVGAEANWFCYIASHATEHAAELDRPTLQRLLALPGDLWLDICGDRTDEE